MQAKAGRTGHRRPRVLSSHNGKVSRGSSLEGSKFGPELIVVSYENPAMSQPFAALRSATMGFHVAQSP